MRRRTSHIVPSEVYESVFKHRVAAGKDTVAFRSERRSSVLQSVPLQEETVESTRTDRHPSFRSAMNSTTVRGTPRRSSPVET